MASSTVLTDPSDRLVADASTIINLIATGSVRAIVTALPNRIALVDIVPDELKSGRSRGREAYDCLEELATAGRIDIVSLDGSASEHFEMLVSGTATATLDDGEAATIAYAVEHNCVALIDERKATRICAQRFPDLRVACTVDVLIHPEVRRQLGPDMVADAVFKALRDGRMGVLSHHLNHIVELIGDERAAQCPSLPRRVRASSERRSSSFDPQ